jgi:hypothetical protein
MRTLAGRSSRGRAIARRLRLLAAFLIPALIAFSVAAAPPASAGPKPSASASPSAPDDVQYLVPKESKGVTYEKAGEYSRKMFANPMGHALLEQIASYPSGHSGNISMEWFDFSWLSPDMYDMLLDELKLPNDKFPGINPNYEMNVKELDYAGNERLFEQMGVPSSARLVQLTTSSIYKDLHSEEIPLERLKISIPSVLRTLNKGMGKKAVAAETASTFQKSSVGLASQRGPCVDRCDPQTIDFRTRWAMAYYGLQSDTEQHGIAANIISLVDQRALPLLGKERALAQQIADMQRVRASEATIAELLAQQQQLTQPATPCDPQAAGQSGSGDTQGMALMAFSSGAPCGDGEGAPGGLVKALTSANLGGVDFSTLQMRYMSDNPDSTGLQYAFSGQADTSATPQDIDTALSVLTDNAADLRTWLVLNPDEFWVNLNPSEPGRIIDAQLGETNAGRELLDADFQLKRGSATLMNPNTTLGAQYWHELAGSSPSVCYGSRMWIVPGQVQVREDGGSLYILRAQLAVKAVPDHVADMPASCHYDAQTDARGQRLDQTMIVPLITKMVNTAPQYAPIRRTFMARIVAQWIRDRHANGQRTSFDSLIDSGKIGPARLQDGWQPQQVFDAYVKSLKDGEFTYNTTFRQGGATYIQKITIGGVDFTSLTPTALSAAQMNQQYPQLAQTARSSVTQLISSGGSLWLGDTIAPPSGSAWSKLTDPVRSFASGRTGILILVLAGLAVVTFGIRRGSRRGRQAT